MIDIGLIALFLLDLSCMIYIVTQIIKDLRQ